MPRTIVDIPPAQMREVDRVCQALRISRAEAVRRALADFVLHNGNATTDGFGLWRRRESSPERSSEEARAE